MNSEIGLKFPKGLHEAIVFFANEEKAFEFMTLFRWPGGVECPFCGSMRHTLISNRRVWQCKNKGCRRQFTIKVKTLMEDSALSLSHWASAIWTLGSAKNGASSCELSRSMQITQKSAWFLLHRVREMMKYIPDGKFSGTVEADEMFVGGLEKFKHIHKKQQLGRGGVGKAIVLGILQRGKKKGESKFRAKVIPDTTRETLHKEIKEHVELGSEVFTDAHKGYRGLSPEMAHAWVDHATAYCEGRIHSNGCENFWSLFSMMLSTYTHVDPRHLQGYLDEQIHRFNTRSMNCLERFVQTLMNAAGRRLTYQQLTTRGLEFVMPAK